MSTVPVENTREGFGQSQPVGRHLGGDRDDVAASDCSGRHTQPGSQPAVDPVADEFAVTAQVLASGQAGPTGATGDDDGDGGLLSDGQPLDPLAEGGDPSGDLVSESDPRAHPGGFFTGDDAEVGAANRRRLDGQDDLAAARRGNGFFGKVNVSGAIEDQGRHGVRHVISFDVSSVPFFRHAGHAGNTPIIMERGKTTINDDEMTGESQP